MFDGGNSNTQPDDFTQKPALNSQTSQDPNQLNYARTSSGLSSYPSMSYGNQNSYGGYGANRSFGNYGNYGSYGGYNSNSYGPSSGYNSGYSTAANSFSNNPNQHGRPMPPQGENMPIPPPNFRQDVWGFLNGFHAMLNVLYAGTGIVHFGRAFIKMSYKIMRAVFGKSLEFVFKLTGLNFLKSMVTRLANKSGGGDWLGEFNLPDSHLENAWANGSPGNSSTLFGKILLVLRICSLLGATMSLFLRNKMNNKMQQEQPPLQVELMGPSSDVDAVLLSSQPDNKEEDIVNSLLAQIKQLNPDIAAKMQVEREAQVEEKENMNSDLTKSLYEEIKELDSEIALKAVDNIDNQELHITKEDSKCLSLSNSGDIDNLKTKLHQSVEETHTNALKTAPLTKNLSRSVSTVVSDEEKLLQSPAVALDVNEKQSEIISQLENNTSAEQKPANLTSETQRTSEEFWKHDSKSQKDETVQKVEPVEVPRMLQSLRLERSSSSVKPWLMKKKTIKTETEVPSLSESLSQPPTLSESVSLPPTALVTKIEE